MTRRIAAAILIVVVVIGGWLGYRAMSDRGAAPVAAVQQDLPGADQPGDDSIETIDTGAASLANGGTPMAQRVAVIGLLNKRNGDTREVTLKPGQATRMGDVVLRLRACEQTAPWEPVQLTGAFVQLDVRGADSHWRRVFSGWLYKERPALNVVIHPVYDVWTRSCATTFPGTAPSTPAKASSAKKSPVAASATAAADDEAADEPIEESAAPNNSM